MNTEETPKAHASSRARPTRRQAMQWVLAAVAASSLPTRVNGQPKPPQDMQQEEAVKHAVPSPKGYGLDANLVDVNPPGAFWKLTLTDAQKKTAAALADTILPKDHFGPAASEVGVIEMMDEWISSPYPQTQGDRPIIIDGLAWLEAECTKRFGKGFADLDDQQKHAVCDDICFTQTAKPQFKKGASFFSRFRSLAAGAYYSTPEGWNAIGYIGNVPLPRFDGPPAAVLEKLGVTQTVK